MASTLCKGVSRGWGACAVGIMLQHERGSPGRHYTSHRNDFIGSAWGSGHTRGCVISVLPCSAQALGSVKNTWQKYNARAKLKQFLFHGLEDVNPQRLMTKGNSWLDSFTKSGWEDVKVAIKSEVFKEKRQIIWTESLFSFQHRYMSLN